jgi:ribonuclease HI
MTKELDLQLLQGFYDRTKARAVKYPHKGIEQNYTKDTTQEPIATILGNKENVIFYTDGSFNPFTKTASYAVIKEILEATDNYTCYESERIPGVQNNYRTELFAILRALINTKTGQQVLIRTDSLSAVQAIKAYNPETTEDSDLTEINVIHSIHKQKMRLDNRVKLEWIKAHTGIPGNESADKYAKEALNHKVTLLKEPGGSFQYTLTYNNEHIYNELRTTIRDITRQQLMSNNNYKYSTLSNDYHNITIWSTGKPLGVQRFIMRARGNQLCTNIKMNYWSNNTIKPTCKRCNTEKKDQWHLFIDCVHNKKLYHKTALEIHKILFQKTSQSLYTEELHLWCLPYSISFHGVQHRPNLNNEEKLTMYKGLLGLIHNTTIKYWEARFKLQVLRKIYNLISEMTYSLWNNRCMNQAIT